MTAGEIEEKEERFDKDWIIKRGFRESSQVYTKWVYEPLIDQERLKIEPWDT
jgi:hypothetical protein